MATIKAKITKAEINQDNTVSVVVELAENTGFKWQKSFNFYTTQSIDADEFKAKIAAEVKRDLQIAKQLDKIKPLVGKEFTLTI